MYFNPRPPRGERHLRQRLSKILRNFNPRPPRGERRPLYIQFAGVITISIHALREESDIPVEVGNGETKEFQSTPSARRATLLTTVFKRGFVISIHALREESDKFFFIKMYAHSDFNPRPPRGERLNNGLCDGFYAIFQSTPSARRATAPGQ